MDSQEQLFFDDYFSLFPTLEENQLHSPLIDDLSSNDFLQPPPNLTAPVNFHSTHSPSSSSDYTLSQPEEDDHHFIHNSGSNSAANNSLYDNSLPLRNNTHLLHQPLFYNNRKLEQPPVITHYQDNSSYMNESLSVNNTPPLLPPPPVKIYHILEHGVMPKENGFNNHHQPVMIHEDLSAPSDETIKKKRRRRTSRHIPKDLNAPSGNPVDISDPEILTGAVLKPSLVIPPFPVHYETHLSAITNPPILPNVVSKTNERNSVMSSATVIPPPLKSPPPAPPVNSQSSEIAINFSREELLQISSDDFEEHVRQLSSVRPLSSSERNVVKRQRRLIKNRESAQASRQRKKDYVGDLEKKVGDLISNNAKLKEEFSSLTAENKQLKNEVEFLSELVGKVKVSEV